MRSLFISFLITVAFLLPARAMTISSDMSVALRQDITRLARLGLIKTPVSTWPVFWPALIEELQAIDPRGLSSQVRDSYRRVYQEASWAISEKSRTTLKITHRSEERSVSNFETSANDPKLFSFEQTSKLGRLEAHLNLSSRDRKNYDALSGSYLGYKFQNSFLGIGQIDHWWGNGDKHSLILSNNAPPRPGVFWRSAGSKGINFPILKWLGPYSFSAFAEMLDDPRYIEDAKFFGFSASFKPFHWLELSGRRLAQWGGEGRPESWDNFLDLLVGSRDNCGDADCKPNEPGNQMASIELALTIPKWSNSLFVQYTGDDESNYFPSRGVFQFGLQQDFVIEGDLVTLFFEASDTGIKSTSRARFNTFYNHGIYKSGMRYHGRAFGAPFDNDTKLVFLGVRSTTHDNVRGEISMELAEINYDSIEQATSNHLIAPYGGELFALQISVGKTFDGFEVDGEIRYANVKKGGIPALEEGGSFGLSIKKSF